ncbi:MAG: ParB/RepB/Spo0J family partition protein [Candidatus Uhrbacteria bacterium]
MPRGLGRGLSALIPDAPADVPQRTGDGSLLEVPLERIRPNPLQPRRAFPKEELDALADSIREHGLLQPLVVTRCVDGAYELIAGERRLRASQLAGLAAVPIVVREGEVSEQEKLELAVIENVQRQNLNAIDRALAYEQLQRDFGLTQEVIAQRLSISRSSVAHAVRLLVLPLDIQDAVRDGRISEGHAKVLTGMTNPAEQRAWFERILAQGTPVAEVSRAAQAQRDKPSRRTSEPRAKDANIAAKERALQQRLQARVRITPKADGGGVIAVTYSDAEELSGIMGTIGVR